ncbi:MAG: hypothetical protein AAFW81_10930 [Pseudomonadota bacterium]
MADDKDKEAKEATDEETSGAAPDETDAAKTASSVPEVDAEIVGDDADNADDVAAAFEPPPKDADTEHDEPAASSKRKSFISPGVAAFLILVLVALGAGAYWFATKLSSDDAAPPTASRPVPPSVAAPTSEPPGQKVGNESVVSDKDGIAAAPGEDAAPIETITQASDHIDRNIDNAEFNTGVKDADADAGTDPAGLSTDAEEDAFSFEIDAAEEGEGETGVREATQADENDVDDASAMEGATGEGEGEPGAGSTDAGLDEAGVEPTDPNAAAAETPPDTEVDASATNTLADAGSASAETSDALTQARAENGALSAELATARDELAAANRAIQNAADEADALRAEIGALRARIGELERENAFLAETAENSPLTAGAVALAEIARSLETGAPFDAQLSAIGRIAPEAEAVGALRPFAASGAPTRLEVQRAFAPAAREGLAVAGQANAGNDWERFIAHAASVVSVRPAAPREGETPRAIMSRVEHAVGEGDFAWAIAELEALPASAREAMADWTQLARQRIAIEAAVASLNARIAQESGAAKDAL